MRAVIQRVKHANVAVDEKTVGEINAGLLILVGIEEKDHEEDALWLAQKIVSLRIFADENQLMNKSVNDIGGEILVVSQFTLHAKTKKGNRPSFVHAASPEKAIPLYNFFIDTIQKNTNHRVRQGIFGANMQVQLLNDGPVTIIIDTKNKE